MLIIAFIFIKIYLLSSKKRVWTTKFKKEKFFFIIALNMYYPSIDVLQDTVSDFVDSKVESNTQWYVEEKIDGSQLSFQLEENALVFRNKSKLAPENNIFGNSIEMLKKENKIRWSIIPEMNLSPDFTYHGEAVGKTKHGVIQYFGVPRLYWICFDIYNKKEKCFLSPEEKRIECERLGLDITPTLYQNEERGKNPYTVCHELVEKIEKGEISSCLGGTPEGVVLKHHHFFRRGEYVATKRKLVCSEFKERQRVGQVKNENDANEFLKVIGKSFSTRARFRKAIQHLQESGKWNEEELRKNIRALEKELDADLEKEYLEEITTYMINHLLPIVKKHAREDFYSFLDELGSGL